MSFQFWLAYLVTVLILMSVPGPSHLLMLSNSMNHGFGRSLATAAGDLTANLLQMLAAGLGLAAIVLASEAAFGVVKWGGVLYLVWLGVRMIRTPIQLNRGGSRVGRRKLWMQGFVTSAANPKAVVFFAALFPQFIRPDQAFWPQLAILSLTYLIVDACFLMTYGAGAGWIATRLRAGSAVWINRVGGALLIGAAIMLGLKTARD